MAHFILFVCESLVVVKLVAMHVAVAATEVVNYASGKLYESAMHYERRQQPPVGIRNTPASRILLSP